MLAKTPIGQRFYNFVAAQEPERVYRHALSSDCACAQFIQEELGISRNDTVCSFHDYWIGRAAGHPLYPSTNLVLNDIWTQFNDVAGDCAPNYGALRQHLEEHMPELVT